MAGKATRVADFIDEYMTLIPLYEKLVCEVEFVLKEKLKLKDVGIVSILGRAKSVESLREKILRKNYTRPGDEVTDLAGVRVICNYEADLAIVKDAIRSSFALHEHLDKTLELGTDRMGYHGNHFVVSLGSAYSGVRYDDIREFKCEIQIRTVLQDAWAIINHHLVYKEEKFIPDRLKRDLNNVASLLEVAQSIFDSVRDKRNVYLSEIRDKESSEEDFLAQPVSFDTLWAYTEWKFPRLPVSERWHNRLLQDLDLHTYPTLKDIDRAVETAKPAVEAYKAENPGWFKSGTGHVTKSLGFVDIAFRQKHPWGQKTRDAFPKYIQLLNLQFATLHDVQ